MAKTEVLKLLENWDELNAALADLELADVMKLLEAEATGRRRVSHLKRLWGRFNKLRYPLEEVALFQHGEVPWRVRLS
jgi:hypothetical protein